MFLNKNEKIAGRCNRVINERSPIVDARLSDGSRVNAVISPAALNGPILTIRRFPKEPITMDKLIRLGSLTEEAALFLEDLVRAGYSSVISGGTSAGKTTFLNALSNYIPKNERIITIEDNAELQLQGIDNLVRLEAKMANMEGNTEITIRDLIRSSLRMRTDRIIVGEVRGGEAADMLQCFNTGHEGSSCSIHANSCYDAISRLETMVIMALPIPLAAIRRQIAGTVAQECDSFYEGALAVISCMMNRADMNYGGYGTTAYAQATASGEWAWDMPGHEEWHDYCIVRMQGGFGGIPDHVRQAVSDCLSGAARNHSYTNMYSSHEKAEANTGRTITDYVEIGTNCFFN